MYGIKLLDGLWFELPLAVLGQRVIEAGLVDSDDERILFEQRGDDADDVDPICVQSGVLVADLLGVLLAKREVQLLLHDDLDCALTRHPRQLHLLQLVVHIVHLEVTEAQEPDRLLHGVGDALVADHGHRVDWLVRIVQLLLDPSDLSRSEAMGLGDSRWLEGSTCLITEAEQLHDLLVLVVVLELSLPERRLPQR